MPAPVGNRLRCRKNTRREKMLSKRTAWTLVFTGSAMFWLLVITAWVSYF
nr:hypothetical protein [Winslowiella iniecta]